VIRTAWVEVASVSKFWDKGRMGSVSDIPVSDISTSDSERLALALSGSNISGSAISWVIEESSK